MQWRAEAPSGGLLDFAVADARGADAETFGGTVNQAADALEIDVPPASGEIVGVTDSITEARSLPANVATLSHGLDLLRA